MSDHLSAYENEAARDAAIPSPLAGMSACIINPTIPAATGDDEIWTQSPIITVYDGDGWVCENTIFATTNASGTRASTTHSATLSGTPGTNATVTLETGTRAIVEMTAEMYNTGYRGGAKLGVSVSGASTVAFVNTVGASHILNANDVFRIKSSNVITGLTAGVNTFTLGYGTAISGTAYFSNRAISVKGYV